MDIKELIELRLKPTTIKALADLAGINRKRAEKFCRLLTLNGPEWMQQQTWETLFPGSGSWQRTHKLNVLGKELDRRKSDRETKELRIKYQKSLDELERLKQAYETLKQVSQRPRTETIVKSSSGKRPGVCWAVLSDVHAGEQVEQAQVNGLNQYNPDICKSRCYRFFENLVKLVKQMQWVYEVQYVGLALLGDLITGFIHEEQVLGNSMTPVEELRFIQEILCSGIDYLLDNLTEDLYIPCCVGNHGRTTAKKWISSDTRMSYETILYQSLAGFYSKNIRVRFEIATGYHLYHDCLGHVLRFHHGDACRYGGGVGGISIPLNKAISQWNRIKPAALDVLGHFHQVYDGQSFITNGSVVGYNSYALQMRCSYEVPRQVFFVIDKEHGKTWTTPVFLE